METKQAFIKVNNISKKFGDFQALKNISFSIYLGEILAIVGDNGAGKSTLINILSGNLPIGEGEIFVNNNKISQLDTKKALDHGVTTVYQNLALVDTKDAVYNIFLGKEIKKGPFLDTKKMAEMAKELIDSLDVNIPDIHQEVGSLSGGQRQALAITRAIYLQKSLIILDEPTAAMGVAESKKIIDMIKDLKKSQKGIVLISHDLPTAYELADRFLVLKHGQLQTYEKKENISYNELLAAVAGTAKEEKVV